MREGAADRAVNLTNGAEVIRQMRDAGDHAIQLHLVVVTWRSKCFEPNARLSTERFPQRSPFLIVDHRTLPACRPVCRGPGITLPLAPSIHERQTIPDMIDVGRDACGAGHGRG